jgi:hypothetical protein
LQYTAKNSAKIRFCQKAGFEPITPWRNSGGHCKNVCAKFSAKIGFRKKTIFAVFPQPADFRHFFTQDK